MKKTFLMLLLIALITGCASEDLPETEKLGVLTQKYWAHQGLDYSGNDVYLIYTFSVPGKFDVEERNGSRNGELIRSYYGTYEFKNPDINRSWEMHMKIYYSAECPECFNSFIGKRDEKSGSFSYTIYDMVSGKNKELKFVPL